MLAPKQHLPAPRTGLRYRIAPIRTGVDHMAALGEDARVSSFRHTEDIAIRCREDRLNPSGLQGAVFRPLHVPGAHPHETVRLNCPGPLLRSANPQVPPPTRTLSHATNSGCHQVAVFGGRHHEEDSPCTPLEQHGYRGVTPSDPRTNLVDLLVDLIRPGLRAIQVMVEDQSLLLMRFSKSLSLLPQDVLDGALAVRPHRRWLKPDVGIQEDDITIANFLDRPTEPLRSALARQRFADVLRAMREKLRT